MEPERSWARSSASVGSSGGRQAARPTVWPVSLCAPRSGSGMLPRDRATSAARATQYSREILLRRRESRSASVGRRHRA